MKYSAKPLQKLRNRFFALILSVFLVIIIGAFSVVYLNTYNNVQREITARLETGWRPPFGSGEIGGVRVMSDPLLVRINLSLTGEIVGIDSLLDMPQDILEQMVDAALYDFSPGHVAHWADSSETGDSFHVEFIEETESVVRDSVSVGGREWRFVSAAGSVSAVTDEAGNTIVSEIEQSLTFLDVTEFNSTLSSLLYTLLVIAFLLVPITALISFYFSNRAVRPIAAAWDKQKQFIADAAHELKTPITIMKSNLGIVMSNPGETVNEQMEWLEYVETGANRMSKLTADLLSLANADSSDMMVQNEHFDASVALTGLIQSMTAKADARDIEIDTSITSGVTICNDREKFIQIVTILLDNAVKYSEPTGTVKVTLSQINQRLSVSVTNGGKGIKKTEIPHVFDRFYQTEPSRNSGNEGFGLGLSIAKALTDKLGGSLSVVSGENEDTTFMLVL